jgi:hypothetical protein
MEIMGSGVVHDPLLATSDPTLSPRSGRRDKRAMVNPYIRRSVPLPGGPNPGGLCGARRHDHFGLDAVKLRPASWWEEEHLEWHTDGPGHGTGGCDCTRYRMLKQIIVLMLNNTVQL